MLLWNVEGLTTINSLIPINFWNRYNIVIATDTFLTDHINIPNMYCKHALATKKEKGRPEGGVTCMYKHTIGIVKETHTEENMVIIRTDKLSIIGLYISPLQKVDDAIEHIVKAISIVKNDQNIILGGDLNCRIDKPDHKATTVIDILHNEGINW